MKYNMLGNTDIRVSRICLGTMTFGEQNTENEGHLQLDYALDQGINFIDTAEMYSVPPRAETQGSTEKIIGSWIQSRNNRDRFVLASKVTGPDMNRFSYLRNGPRLTRQQIHEAIEGSLSRLKTDYLDLYQLHWPDRNCNFFGKLGYQHKENEDFTPLEETLSAMQELVQAGKVRHIGLSNDTPWGVMKALQIAEKNGWNPVVSIQNPYNLVNRSFEVGLAEISIREQVGLLAYSPMAFGALSGKYLSGQDTDFSRLNRFPGMARYRGERTQKAVEDYVHLAKEYDLSPAQMALAYVNSRPFLTSNIIGATNLDQLKENIDSIQLELSESCLARIEQIHLGNPNPAP